MLNSVLQDDSDGFTNIIEHESAKKEKSLLKIAIARRERSDSIVKNNRTWSKDSNLVTNNNDYSSLLSYGVVKLDDDRINNQYNLNI